jgi:predicted transcriptional regulator
MSIILTVVPLYNLESCLASSIYNGIVMSIQPRYSRQILNGNKRVEIRKKFNKKWKDHKVTIYSSSPSKELLGYAKIEDVVEDNPEVIWSCFSDKLGCSKSEFDSYTKGENKIFAIVLSEIDKFKQVLPLSYLSNLINKKIYTPKSYHSVINTDWKQVISVAELIHGRFNVI